jgi:hypothetical protein
MIGAGLFLALSAGPVGGSAAEEFGLGVEGALVAVQQEMERLKSAVKGSGNPPYFTLKGTSLRIHFVMVREEGPDGKPRMKILPVEAGQTYPEHAIHTVTLQLERTHIPPGGSRQQGAVPGRRERPRPSPKTQQPEPTTDEN